MAQASLGNAATMQAGDPIAVSLLTPSLRLMAKALSHVAVYTLAALAAQDAPQAAIAQSLRIDAPPMLVGLAAPQDLLQAMASVYATIAPPEVAAMGLEEWADSTGAVMAASVAPVEFADPLAVREAIRAGIAPPETLDRAIASPATQNLPRWQPPSAPSVAIREAIRAGIAPPEPLFEEPIGLEASVPLFDPWIDAEELSLLDAEWWPLQHQNDLWDLLADLPADGPTGYWG
ncbi:hypothetical protein HNI00_09835 [Thermoleptolyngbya oregonensis NK1-22]|uniref:Uncharacterized protein n=1 Tax=Thermoleptolyngbya oregonensis NK1-22 TaxID=2547457 RepID=A0AA97BPT4_9CYAN|nr:hypothetical protein [Thermoleptolyngbya oregonensis]WOB43423.1 hypothetical protein HNI00_09835 [Thermoleptolyngbya oregonensis NK1-22]